MDDHQLHARQRLQQPRGAAVRKRCVKLVDQRLRVAEARPAQPLTRRWRSRCLANAVFQTGRGQPLNL
jgi:hypothetical protein